MKEENTENKKEIRFELVTASLIMILLVLGAIATFFTWIFLVGYWILSFLWGHPFF